MKHRPGTLPPQEAAKHERVPVGAPVSVPPEHWGLMNRWLLLLWKARSMPQAEFDEQRSRLEAEIIETAARHYFAEPEPCDCHEPGTCPSLSTCQRCQQAMSAAVELPRDKRPDSQRLLLALAGDEPARLNIRRAFDYVRQIEQSRFIRERVRLAWSLWEKLRSRGRLLLAQAIQAQEGDAR
ncbi:MAG: hypothetical protein H5T86_15280 [Armatimonadetes bacterium]|nr:hypothetical protein [Armatimonadota bacterium]